MSVSADDIRRRLSASQSVTADSLRERLQPEAVRSALDQSARTGAGGFISAMLNVPHAIGEMIAVPGSAIAAGVQSGGNFIRGRPADFMGNFDRNMEASREIGPASALLKSPQTTTQDVMNVAGAVRNLPSEIAATPADPIEAFRRAYAEGSAEESAEAEARPMATQVGDIGGDIAALFSLRPSWKKIFEPFTKAKVGDEAAEVANKAGNQFLRLLGRGTARATEAGFEGAVVAALNDGDPLSTAAWSAGIQAGGSAALGIKAGIRRNPLAAFGSLWLGHEMYKAVLPGPQQFVESKDQVVREFVAAYGLAAVAGALGASRGTSTQFASQVGDAIARTSRGAISSVVTQLNEAKEAGQPEYERVVATVLSDPSYFGEEVRRRLERAANSDRPEALINAIDSLFKNGGFRRKYEQIASAP